MSTRAWVGIAMLCLAAGRFLLPRPPLPRDAVFNVQAFSNAMERVRQECGSPRVEYTGRIIDTVHFDSATHLCSLRRNASYSSGGGVAALLSDAPLVWPASHLWDGSWICYSGDAGWWPREEAARAALPHY